MKSKIILILKICISLSLLIVVFTRIDLPKLWEQVQYLSFPFVLFALLYYTACQWLSCLRWQVILKANHYPVSIRNLLAGYFAGMFVSIFLPSSYGGDVYRIYRLNQSIHNLEVSVSSVFLERFAGLAAIFALALLGLPPIFQLMGSWEVVGLFLLCASILSGGFLLILSPQLLSWMEPLLMKLHLTKIVERIAKTQIIFRKFVHHRQAVSIAIGLSLVIQLSVIYYQYLLAQQLKIPVSFLELLIFTPISIVVTLLPISFGGLGVQEGLWAYLFSRVGLPAEQAVLLSLTFTLLGWLLSLPGGIILFLDSLRSRVDANPPANLPSN
ncbi:MAG: lysylphosphatidylglycerol synthase transmembrane domain-containing protein [Leptolyngbyaceae cyanobacterium bins.349]|nr:lysylphosphatidylglycerol synthase transmembrane domain-containing protein [Leptolyngbyaceae cyanobacterium bins.349]